MSRHRSDTPELRWADGVLPAGRLFAKVPEAASVLRTDERTLRAALEAGQVPGFRVGQHWRVPVSWLRRQAELGGNDGAPAA